MVTSQHETLHQIFRFDQDLVARAVSRVFGVAIDPPLRVEVLNTDLTDFRPLVRKADSVILAEFLVEERSRRYIVVVESQTERDEEKRWTWPNYIASLRDRFRCPVLLLVVSSKESTAKWARTTITSGLPGLTCMYVQPVVLGPDNVPPVTDLAQAREDVAFTALSALTHSRSEVAHGILEVLATALTSVETADAAFFTEFVEAGLSETGYLTTWRTLMFTQTQRYPYASQLRLMGREEGREEGRIEERIELILRALDRRGITVSEEDRVAIASCRDLAMLETWFDRAVVITDIRDLFAA